MRPGDVELDLEIQARAGAHADAAGAFAAQVAPTGVRLRPTRRCVVKTPAPIVLCDVEVKVLCLHHDEAICVLTDRCGTSVRLNQNDFGYSDKNQKPERIGQTGPGHDG